MEINLQQKFIKLWNKYFPGANLPIVFFYTDEKSKIKSLQSPKKRHCMIHQITDVLNGKSIYFDIDTIICEGGKRHLGFTQTLRQNFEYFLSCGIPGKMEGERYKKSPDLVKKHLENQPSFKAPGEYIIFKKWDKIDENDQPSIVIFFAKPDILVGLFTLANFDELDANAVIAPFGSGCGSIVYHPYKELQSQNPRAIIGMFDVSARPYVPSNILTFAVPFSKFTRMINNMEESFLTTKSWDIIKKRIRKEQI
jgi:uncharacterized protein (DUF169 family)